MTMMMMMLMMISTRIEEEEGCGSLSVGMPSDPMKV